jgi:hypothetical protein
MRRFLSLALTHLYRLNRLSLRRQAFFVAILVLNSGTFLCPTPFERRVFQPLTSVPAQPKIQPGSLGQANPQTLLGQSPLPLIRVLEQKTRVTTQKAILVDQLHFTGFALTGRTPGSRNPRD